MKEQPMTDQHAQPTDPFAPRPSSPAGAGDSSPIAPIAPIAPVAPVAVRRRSGSGVFVNVLLGLALVVAVGGVAFAVGRSTAPAVGTGGRANFGTNGQGFGPNASGAPGGGFGGAGAGGLSVEGTVTAISADSITVQLTSGQSVTIPTNAQTTWHQREAATAADVTSGSTVIVQLQGGRGALGAGNGNGGQGNGPNASGAPGRTLGAASTVTLVPAGS
jgi:hypothetical protein